MIQDLQEFLTQRLTDNSVVAWGVRFSSVKSFVQNQKDWFTSEQVEQMIHQLVLAANNLTFHRIDPVRLCWVYDRIRIFLAFRPDNACLGVVVENRPGVSFGEVEKVLDAFLARPQA